MGRALRETAEANDVWASAAALQALQESPDQVQCLPFQVLQFGSSCPETSMLNGIARRSHEPHFKNGKDMSC